MGVGITQEVLRTPKWDLQHLIDRQSRLIRKLADVWQLDVSIMNAPGILSDSANTKTGKGFTESALIEGKRQTIVKALAKRETIHLEKIKGALYSSMDGKIKAICTISKRYSTGSPYWYGYAPQWDDFLSTAETAFMVLGCMDKDRAYAIPHDQIKKLLPHLHRTPERHWHLALEEDEHGRVEISVPKMESRVRLKEFEVTL